MADNKKKRGGADRGLIALSEPYEVAYWSKKFKITPAKLKSAVKKAGRSAKNVEAYIKLQKHKAADRARIAVSQPYEVSYWSKKFKVTPGPIEGRGGRRRAFVESRRRPSRQGQGFEEGEERQQGSQENDKEARKEKGRLAAAFRASRGLRGS